MVLTAMATAAHLVLIVAAVMTAATTACAIVDWRWWRCVATHHVRIVHVWSSVRIVASLGHALHGRIDWHWRLTAALAAAEAATAAALIVAATIGRVLRATAAIWTAWASAVRWWTRAWLTSVKVLTIARLILWSRLLGRDNKRTSFHLFAVEAHGRLNAVLVLEFDESGALRVARLHVLDDGDAHDLAAANERVA